MAKNDKIPVFSVAQLNALIKGALDNSLPGRFLLRGQVSALNDVERALLFSA
jgi:exonuclease VII large subunit